MYRKGSRNIEERKFNRRYDHVVTSMHHFEADRAFVYRIRETVKDVEVLVFFDARASSWIAI
jgi:hypothetical protein